MVLLVTQPDNREILYHCPRTLTTSGIGIPAKLPKKSSVGLIIMNRRASEIGATLSVRRAGGRGTVVSYTLSAGS